MLTKEENDMLTCVGPGTPAGELLRKYWHPLIPSIQIGMGEAKRAKLLGEDLVVFRLEDGSVGVMDEHCPHRKASLAFGFVEEGGIRCAYHGWKFAPNGKCIDQPFEPEASHFRDRIKQKAYRIEDFCGMLWIYMGPEPAPLLPKYKLFNIRTGLRWIMYSDIKANWLQLVENMHDGQHVYYLHGEMMKRRLGIDTLFARRPASIEFVKYEWGIIPKRTFVGKDGEVVKERGHPIVFPNLNYALPSPSGITCNFFIPVDDTHSRFIALMFLPTDDHSEIEQELIPAVDGTPYVKTEKDYNMDNIHGTDLMAWETQGQILDRTQEHLGASDRGVAMYRLLLKREIEKVRRGLDPVGIHRENVTEVAALDIENTIIDYNHHKKINKKFQDIAFKAVEKGEIPTEIIGFGGKVYSVPTARITT